MGDALIEGEIAAQWRPKACPHRHRPTAVMGQAVATLVLVAWGALAGPLASGVTVQSQARTVLMSSQHFVRATANCGTHGMNYIYDSHGSGAAASDMMAGLKGCWRRAGEVNGDEAGARRGAASRKHFSICVHFEFRQHAPPHCMSLPK